MEMKELFESTYIAYCGISPEVIYVIGDSDQVYVITTDEYKDFRLYAFHLSDKNIMFLCSGTLRHLVNSTLFLTEKFRTVYYDITE